MTAILTSVARVRTSLASIVQMTCGSMCTAVYVTAPRGPNRPYTVEIPLQYRRQVYEFLAQHLAFGQLPDEAESLSLTDQQAAQVVRLACEAAERAAAQESSS